MTSSTKPVRAIERAFAVLGAVAETGSASLRDVELRTGLPRPTIVRILQTLLDQGVLRRGLRDERYHLGYQLALLAQQLGPRELLAAIAAPRLNALSELTGWPAVVAVFEPDPGEYMLVLESSAKVSRFFVRSVTKARINLLLSSLGLAWLAWQPAETLDAVLAQLRATQDPSNLAGLAAGGLPERLQAVRQQGYAWRDPRYRGGSWNEPPSDDRLNSLAVPLLYRGHAFGVLNVYWHRKAMEVADVARAYLPRIHAAAIEIAEEAARRGVAQALRKEQGASGNRD